MSATRGDCTGASKSRALPATMPSLASVVVALCLVLAAVAYSRLQRRKPVAAARACADASPNKITDEEHARRRLARLAVLEEMSKRAAEEARVKAEAAAARAAEEVRDVGVSVSRPCLTRHAEAKSRRACARRGAEAALACACACRCRARAASCAAFRAGATRRAPRRRRCAPRRSAAAACKAAGVWRRARWWPSRRPRAVRAGTRAAAAHAALSAANRRRAEAASARGVRRHVRLPACCAAGVLRTTLLCLCCAEIPPERQRLVFAGQILAPDDKDLALVKARALWRSTGRLSGCQCRSTDSVCACRTSETARASFARRLPRLPRSEQRLS